MLRNCCSRAVLSRGFKTSTGLKEVVIVSAVRTPFGGFMGQLKDTPATKLGSIAIKEAVARAGLQIEQVEEVYMGNVISAGAGQAPARQAALGAGCEVTTPCTTINKVCASGMKAVMMAAQNIACGGRDIMVAGGMENMSRVPMFEDRAQGPYGHRTVRDGILSDGLMDAYTKDMHMGHCGEDTASTMGITREDQDKYCLLSYERAVSAYANKVFEPELTPVFIPPVCRIKNYIDNTWTVVEQSLLASELVSVPVPSRKDPHAVMSVDSEFTNVKVEKVPSLRTVFDKNGTITAANSSKISDGAAACVVMSADKAAQLGLKPIARILTMADTAGLPINFPTAPVKAMEQAMANLGLTMADIDRVEINEAFAVVAVACQQMMDIPDEIYNPNGGAISLGHPIGASGARLVGTMAHTMQPGQKGLTGICNGGGGASAMIIEKL